MNCSPFPYETIASMARYHLSCQAIQEWSASLNSSETIFRCEMKILHGFHSGGVRSFRGYINSICNDFASQLH